MRHLSDTPTLCFRGVALSVAAISSPWRPKFYTGSYTGCEQTNTTSGGSMKNAPDIHVRPKTNTRRLALCVAAAVAAALAVLGFLLYLDVELEEELRLACITSTALECLPRR